MTKTIRVPSPAPGTGYRVIRGRDGKMTSVPLLAADVAMYRPLLAMDASFDPNAMRAGNAAERANTRQTAPGTWDADPNDVDLDTRDNEGYDLEDKIRQLLEGKLDPADLDMLIQLIQPDDETAPAQDRRLPRPGGMARDSKITPVMRQRVAEGAVNRAKQKQREVDNLMQRFPALKNARVVG